MSRFEADLVASIFPNSDDDAPKSKALEIEVAIRIVSTGEVFCVARKSCPVLKPISGKNPYAKIEQRVLENARFIAEALNTWGVN